MRTFTRTVSPGWKSGIFLLARRRSASSFSRVSITFMVFILCGALSALWLSVGGTPRPQVRTPLPRGLLPLGLPPLPNLGVVAAQQHLGDVEPFERPRSRVLRMLEEPVLEAFFTQALGLAQHTGHEPYASLDRHQRRRLATGQDRVAHGDLLEPAGVQHPLIHPFEPTAENDQSGARSPSLYKRLGQGPAPRAHVDK